MALRCRPLCWGRATAYVHLKPHTAPLWGRACFRSVTEFYGGIVFLPLYQARKPENTPRPLFLIDENFNLNHAIKIPFLKTKRVEQNEGFS